VEPFIAVDSQGRVYVTDSVAGVVHQISSDGKKVVTWGTKGSGSGQLEKPSGIAVAPDGDVYVADRQLHRISVFKPH
jgi:DNA-binding beta-propeller fold protein YncE